MSEGTSAVPKVIGFMLMGGLACLGILGKMERASRRAAGHGGEQVVESPLLRESREKHNRAATAHNAAVTLMQAGRYQEAIDGFTQALAIQPDSSETLVHRGMAYMAIDMEEKALADFERASPSPAASVDELASFRGDCLFVLGREKEAEETYTEGLALSPDNPKLLLRRAQVRGQLDDYDGALEDFDTLFKQKAGIFQRRLFAEAHYARGLLLISQGKVAEARADMARASELGFDLEKETADQREQNDATEETNGREGTGEN